MKFEWFVASRYLRSRRKQSFISIISIISIGGVALGVATVILVIAVLDGVEHGLKDRFLSNEAHVALSIFDHSFFKGYQERIERIEAIDNVVAASPVIFAQIGLFREHSNTIQDVIYIKGIDPAQEDEVTGFSTFVIGSTDFQNSELIEEAALIKEGETITGGIILGGRLATRLGVMKGDVLRLLIKLVDLGGTLAPDLANFVVIGFYESEMEAYDNNFGFIHIDTAQKLYNQKNRVNFIFVRLTDAELAPQMATKIEDAANFTVLEGMPNARTWMEAQAALFSALQLEKIATVIIEALIILVASFNIASTLIMTVMEKTKDVGTLRTLGSSRGNIMRIFMIQGSVIGTLGTMIGTALGLSLCWLLSTNAERPSYWYVLALVVPIVLQFLIASQHALRNRGGWKFAVGVLWLIGIGFALYCAVRPISLVDLGLSQIYQMHQLPIKINWLFVIFINLLSFAICWLATLYPAWQAANLKPVEALQHE
ncbi:FtsX-like permease family protein [Candidatus Poribacteria bacterium]|nr:FtsX-like permease family protein [Candidatus Poribacteria bacterium]